MSTFASHFAIEYLGNR